MSKRTRYTDEPLRMGERVKDFLPPPSQLVKREKTVKVTFKQLSNSGCLRRAPLALSVKMRLRRSFFSVGSGKARFWPDVEARAQPIFIGIFSA